MSQEWYYVEGGVSRGPITIEEVKTLLGSGQLRPSDLVWHDGMSQWTQAAKVEGLIPRQPLAVAPTTPPPPTSAEWYYVEAGQQHGPITGEEIGKLLASGQFRPENLVWRDGMSQWSKAAGVEELRGFLPSESPTGKRPGQPTRTPSRAPMMPTLLAGQDGLNAASITAAPAPIEWYYCQGGRQQGPITDQQLKQLTASGEVRPSDLVWHDGLSGWAKASTVEGLFPQAAPAALPAFPDAALAGTPSSAPALWNPKWLGAWSLLFSWAFGAFLLARNWKALGEPAKAKRAMIWFYSVFPFLLVVAVVPHVPKYSGLAILAAFYMIEASPQIRLVKERFGEQYRRKSWLKPVGITGLLVVGGGFLIGFASAISEPDIGTITFAEHVDAKTLKTTHEGTTFTTGWVAMIVRSPTTFGDSKLVFSQQRRGEAMWSILSEDTITPEWDTCTKPILLAEPGDYSIRAATSTGKTVAEGLVHIVSK